jgi:hypothetical protein
VGGAITTVGVRTLNNVRVGFPQVAEFALPSTLLPPPASLPGDSHYCLLALLHSTQDQFTATQTNVDQLTVAERKVGQKNLHIVAFVGTPPPPLPKRWAAFQLNGIGEKGLITDLVLDARGYGGQIALVLPRGLPLRDGLEKSLTSFRLERNSDEVKVWQERESLDLRKLMANGRYNYAKAKAMLEAVDQTGGQPLLVAERGAAAVISGLEMHPGESFTAFMVIEPPADAQVGDRFQFRLLQRVDGSRVAYGGGTYSVQILAPSRSSTLSRSPVARKKRGQLAEV